MSAKLTIIFFILICFEIGALLVVLPWLPYPPWGENYLVFLLADKLHLTALSRWMSSGYMRGAVTGLGLVNIWIGVVEIINFKKTVQFFHAELQEKEFESTPLQATLAADALPDKRPAGDAPQSESTAESR